MSEITWSYEKRCINDLIENEINPRQISKKNAEDLKKSLGKFGLCEPLVIQSDGKVIGGHQRLKLLVLLGYKEVDVMVPSRRLNDKEFDELTIRLNKNSGEWDIDILANNWEPEELVDWGFAMEELQLESIPDRSEEKPKVCKLTAKFDNEEDLRHAEVHIAEIINKYASASYKVKVK